MRHLRTLLLCLLLALPTIVHAAPPTHLEADERCFPQTGVCIRTPFLDYWLANDGTNSFGSPLANAGMEILENGNTLLMQHFEHARLEYHQGNPPPYDVLLSQFGRFQHPADPPVPALPGTSYFRETGHNVAPDFFAYWEAHGGLARFGYPLSEEINEQLADRERHRVQYFERIRFERYPLQTPPDSIRLSDFSQQFFPRSWQSPRQEPPTCQPDALAVSISGFAAAGTAYPTITLRNLGDTPCGLAGFLGLALLDAQGQVVPATFSYSASFRGPYAQPPFAIQPGQAAQSILMWPNLCLGDPPDFDPSPPTAIRVTLPNGEGQWTLDHSGSPCGLEGAPKRVYVFAPGLEIEGREAASADFTLKEYLRDITARDYQHAFDLLSPQLQTQLGPFARFATDLSSIRRVDFGITGLMPLDNQTIRVSVRLVAEQTDGTMRYYLGSYDIAYPVNATEVLPGRIVAINITEESP